MVRPKTKRVLRSSWQTGIRLATRAVPGCCGARGLTAAACTRWPGCLHCTGRIAGDVAGPVISEDGCEVPAR